MNKVTTFATALLLCAVSTIASAGSVALPEPETLSLIAIGAVALIIAKTRKRK